MTNEPAHEREQMEREIAMLRRQCAYWRDCCRLATVLMELASREIQEYGQREPGLPQPSPQDDKEGRRNGDDSSGFIAPPFAWN
jgi:hypothetical protein